MELLNRWVVTGQVDRAYHYLSPWCFSCVNIYRDEDKPKAQSPEEAERFLREGMKQISDLVGPVKTSGDALEAPQPHHEDIRLVKHSASKAFVIASIPDYMAEAADCSKLLPGEKLNWIDPGSARKYGNYYTVAFRLTKGGAGAAVLWLVWGKEGGAWKISSYSVITP